ncbi:TPA: helix-turn-helix domain-containing protein [Clostridium perfringens]
MPIKYLRTQRNISQKELAKKLNITPSYLSKIEHNEKSPSFELGLRIAMILDICPFSLSDEYTKKMLEQNKDRYHMCEKCYLDDFDIKKGKCSNFGEKVCTIKSIPNKNNNSIKEKGD